MELASQVLPQPSGMEMVMALLRYISRSAVKLDNAEITQKLLTYLPKEGGVLMETLAQEWIEEGKLIGFDLGKQEGIKEGVKEGIKEGVERGKLEAQRQTILRLLQWRFVLPEAEQALYAAYLEQIHNLEHLEQLVDRVLSTPTLAGFTEVLHTSLPSAEVKP